MFVTIRRYSPKNGACNKASLELLRRQIQEDFLPILYGIEGFHGHYVVSVGGRELVTMTLCDSEEATAQANRCAAEYTLRNPLVFELGSPEITEGDVLTFAEARTTPVAGNPNPQPGENGNTPAASGSDLWSADSRGMLLSASER